MYVRACPHTSQWENNYLKLKVGAKKWLLRQEMAFDAKKINNDNSSECGAEYY